MRKIGRHENQVARVQLVGFSVEIKLTLTGQDLNESFLSGGMLSQFLTFIKTEQHNARAWGAKQCAADDAIAGKLRLSIERNHSSLGGIQKRSFIHDHNLSAWRLGGFDPSQGLVIWLRLK